MPIISIKRDQNNNVSIVRMISTDPVAVVSSTNYALDQMPIIQELNDGTWAWFVTDMILCSASDSNVLLRFVGDDFNTFTVYGETGSGNINPGLANELAYYALSGTTLSGLATSPNGILATDSGGAPSISSTLPVAVQLNITQLGTITTGVWNGSLIDVQYGGTGNNSFTAYSVICAGTSSTGPFQNVSGNGTSGFVLTSNGAGSLPTWQVSAGSGTVNPGTQND
ncbi:MAG: hypothetical protein C5B43_03850, partial [Verrucomicrobia bacterium]